MSDKIKESDKTKTPDKLDKFFAGGDITLNCFISDKGVNNIFEVMISNANDNRVSFLANEIRNYRLNRFKIQIRMNWLYIELSSQVIVS